MKLESYCRTTISPRRRRWLHVVRMPAICAAAAPVLLPLVYLESLVIHKPVNDWLSGSVLIILMFLAGFPTYLWLKRLLYRASLYQNGDFVVDFAAFGGKVTDVDEQHTKGRLRELLVRTKIDRGYRDWRRLGGVHLTQKKINELLQEFPGITFVDPPYPGGYFLDPNDRYMLRTSLVDLYWLADLKSLGEVTVRLHVEPAVTITVKVLTANAELETAVNTTKQFLTIPDSWLEVAVGTSWLRVRVVGGSWLGRQFSDRLKEGIALVEALVKHLHSRYHPLSLNEWTLNDQLEAVPIGR